MAHSAIMMAAENTHEFRLGVAKTLPLSLGVVPFGLAYGILSIGAGLTLAETLLMSLLVFAGASQFQAVVMLQGGAGMPFIVVSTLLINLRHLVMGLSVSQYFAQATPLWRRVLAFAMTDEAYVTSIGHFRDQRLAEGSRYFMIGSGATIYVTWASTSLLGAVAGGAIDDPLRWGLDFAMPAAFLVMLLPQIVSRRVATVVLSSAVVATVSYVLIPGTWYMILAVFAGTLTGVVLEHLDEKRAAA